MSILLVAQLLFALLESARNIEFYRVLQMNTDSVTESLFADYASPLWEDYRILGVTAADSGGQFSLNNREAMLRSISKTNLCSADGLYGLSGSSLLTADMSDVMFDEYMLVTDQQGKVFQALAASYMENNLAYEITSSVYSSYEAIKGAQDEYGDGNASIGDALDTLDSIRESEGSGGPALKKAPRNPSERKSNSDEGEGTTEENLLTTVLEAQKSGVLGIVLPEKDKVSGTQIKLDQTVSHRRLQNGTSGRQAEISLQDQMLFHQYLQHYLDCYTDKADEGGLSYELEYLIGGKGKDAANLKLVVAELLAIREAANLSALAGSHQKREQAGRMAALLAGATANPAVVEVVKLGILAAWAYAESVLDLRCLLQGGRIAVIKSDADWTSNLDAVPSLLSGWSQAKSSEKGITYKEYLGLLLLIHSGESLAMRTMDVQEAAVRQKAGYEAFRMDCLICEADIQAVYEYVPIFFGFVTLLKSGTDRIRIQRNTHYSYLL